MTTHPDVHDWTDLELEQFHDGELVEERSAALSEALRTRPDLRARLAEIVRADAAIARALSVQRVAAGRAAGRWWRRAAVAAAVIVLAGVAAVMWMRGPGAGSLPRMELANREPGPAPEKAVEGYRAVRVVFSLPVRGEGGLVGREAVSEPEAGPAEIAGDFLARLDAAMAGGRVDEAIGLVKGAGPGEREEAYRRFGEAMRSSDTAMAALNELSPEEQIAACKAWIAAGNQRPFAMARLKMLGRRAELEEPVRAAVRELLADDPNLRTWVMSYVPWAMEGS